jgi:hypothetical protein
MKATSTPSMGKEVIMEHNLYAPLMNKVVTEATRPAYKIASNYVSLRSVIGNVSGDGICPENEYFADDYINQK